MERGRGVRALVGLAAAAGLLAVTASAAPQAGATSTPAPSTPAPSAASSTTPSPPSGAVTCGTAEGFTRLADGSLRLLTDGQVLSGTDTLVEGSVVGSGWAPFAWTGSGGDGVLYALTRAGQLRWYRYDGAARGWAAGSGRVVGTGFTPGTKVVNIAVGAHGWVYTVRSDGRLALYQHTGRLTGAATWINGTGFVLGRGWTADELIAPQGDGTLYRQRSGDLIWFRHSDPTAGPVTWANAGRGVRIGTGWRYYDLQALGAGVLLATSAPSGDVAVRRHLDPAGGAASWAPDGPAKYRARSDSFGVTIAPATCA